jgi:hypothetical protein
VTSRGAAVVLIGGLAGEMNTGRWLLGFVARCIPVVLDWMIMGMGFSGSALGVEVALEVAVAEEVDGLVWLKFVKEAGVTGSEELSVETEEMEEVESLDWWWWCGPLCVLWGVVGVSGPAVVLDSTSPSYVGESTPSESSMESWCARVVAEAAAVRDANEVLGCARAAAAAAPPGGFAVCRAIAIGTEAAELASSVRGSLSSSDAS